MVDEETPLPARDDAVSASDIHREDKVETSCNDVFFALFFLAVLFTIIGLAASLGVEALSTDIDPTEITPTEQYTYHGFVIVAALVAALSFAAASIGLILLFIIPQFFVKIALLVTIVLAAAWMIFYFVTGKTLGGILSVLFLVVALWYTIAVWKRIPFATANLITANTAVRANLGVALYGVGFGLIGVLWTICWTVAYAGVSHATTSCDENNVCSDTNVGILILLFLAFFFVQQVLHNIIQATVAGAVATWWYTPEKCGCCSSQINANFFRTVTTSFGSICLGSCFVALLDIVRDLANTITDDGEDDLVGLVAQYISGYLATISYYFNTWAFAYVGLYGMNYLKAGKSVVELFKNRGWGEVVTDNLVGNTLLLISFMVADFMGAVGLAIEAQTDLFNTFGGSSDLVAFFLGFVVGLCISSIVLSNIGSSVNAVIILFAEGPNEFQQNHPELSGTMRKVWNEIYPGSISEE